MIVSKIKQLMKENNISMRKMVTLTGLSTATITNARGPQIIKCRMETLQAIAAALGVQVSDLYEEVGEE